MIGVKYSGHILWTAQKLNRQIKVGKTAGLYRTAAYVRTATRRSLRVRPGAGLPERPPHAHTQGGLRVIDFVVDSAASAAIVGPVKFPGSNFFNEPIPHIHEFGGVFAATKGFWKYPKRSYMRYTLDKLIASGKLPRGFAYSLAKVL